MRISAALPTGVAALLFEAAQGRRELEAALTGHLLAAGFSEVILPVLDYSEPYEPLLSPAARAELYRFVGRDGELLALRADFTPMLARLLAPRLGALPLPLRLFYRGDVVRFGEERAGRPREFYQLGAELVGEAGEAAEAEMLGTFLELLSLAVCKEGIGPGGPGEARGPVAMDAPAGAPVQVVLGFAGALDLPLLEAAGRSAAGRTEPARAGHDISGRSWPGHDVPGTAGPGRDVSGTARPGRDVRGRAWSDHSVPGTAWPGHDVPGTAWPAGHALAAAVARRERAPLRGAPAVLLDVVERGVPRRSADLGPEAAARLNALLALRADVARRFPGIEITVDLAEFARQTLDPRLAPDPEPGGGERPYYDGIVFRAHAGPAGVEVGGGGRYDRLFRALGAEAPAMGFSLGLDRLPQPPSAGAAAALGTERAAEEVAR